jgi:hypothetical protein
MVRGRTRLRRNSDASVAPSTCMSPLPHVGPSPQLSPLLLVEHNEGKLGHKEQAIVDKRPRASTCPAGALG